MTTSLRQFMIISVIGMTVILLSLLYFHFELSDDYLNTHLDVHNKNLATVVSNSILSEGLEQALVVNQNELPSNLQDHISRTLEGELRWVPVIKVKIYNQYGLVIYSTKSEEIGRSARDNKGVQSALQGQSISGVVYRDHVNEFDNQVEKRALHQQYIPVRNRKTHEILGVFEVYTDISTLLAEVTGKQRRAFWMIGGGLVAFYIALAITFLTTHKLLRGETEGRKRHLQELETIQSNLEQRVEERTEELDRSRQFLQSVIDGIANPLMVIRPDLSVALANRAAGDNVKRCYQLHGCSEPCHGDDHPCSFSKVMREGCTARVRHNHRDKDGNLKLVDLVTTPLYGTDGRFEGVIEVEHDITRLVQMQAGLEQSEASLKAIMNNVPDAILTCDARFIINSVNPAAQSMFDLNDDALIGGYFPDFFTQPDQLKALFALDPKQSEAMAVRPDGVSFPAEIWIGPLSIREDLSYVAVVRDITARRQAQRELESARHQFFHQEKMASIGHLAAGILHEVGNPIAAIAGAASALKDMNLEGDASQQGKPMQLEVSEQVDLINEQTVRLSRITREIADFASPKPRERELLDLNGLLSSTTRLLTFDRRFRSVKMALELDRNLPAITGVADQLTQVFMNLLLNAMDATTSSRCDAPTITIRSRVSGECVLVTVEDNGPGMADSIRAHVLEPFFSTKPVGEGSGLGLSLCESIITAHHGLMAIDSAEGKGTRINVVLPSGTKPCKPLEMVADAGLV
jgi:PAS domain S-box-containing protein